MKYSHLGSSGIEVSQICLGTMTWGEQNSESNAHTQLDMALDMGVNFIDTAEMYPVPSRQDSFGCSEQIIGNWLKKTGRRKDIVLATKVTGPCADWMPYIRSGNTRLNRDNIRTAIDGSLRRLQTDYIDLYQTHWPERKTNYFGQFGYEHQPETGLTAIGETMSVLTELVAEGKIRAVGVSNETPWGVKEHLRCVEFGSGCRIASIQNPYNLLNRSFEVGLAEMAIRDRVGLLAYSPLGFGVLTGKYLEKDQPEGARLNLPKFKRFTRYTNSIPVKATKMYAAVARQYGLGFAQMSLAYILQRPFVTSAIIGATNLRQMEENIKSIDLVLSDEVNRAIETVHKHQPNPAP